MGSGAMPLVRRSERLCPPEADDIFLFQILISFKNYHIDLEYLDYMTIVGARLHQHNYNGQGV